MSLPDTLAYEVDTHSELIDPAFDKRGRTKDMIRGEETLSNIDIINLHCPMHCVTVCELLFPRV